MTPDDDLAERLLDLGAQVALVPEHRRVQLELLVARIERFVDGATRTPAQRQETR